MDISNITVISLNLMIPNFEHIEKEYLNQFETVKYIKRILNGSENVIDETFILPSLTDLFHEFNGKNEKLSSGKYIHFGKFKSKISGNVILFGKVTFPWNDCKSEIRFPAYIQDKFILMDENSIEFYIGDLIV